jgi:hypothetical protein
MKTLLFSIVGMVLYIFSKELAHSVGFIGYVPLILGMAFWSFLGGKVNRIEKKTQYVERVDTTFQALEHAGLLNGDASKKIHFSPLDRPKESIPEFTLFLRPFSVDHVRTRNPELDISLQRFIPLAKYNIPTHVDLDEAIRFALRKEATFISLSSIPDGFGAVKIARLEDDWRLAIDEFAPLADSIIILPGVRDGTMWEIERLIALKLLRKCIFVFLPHPIIVETLPLKELDFSSIKEALNCMGLAIPDKTSNGATIGVGDAVVFNDEGKVANHVSNVFERQLTGNNFRIKQLRKSLAFVKSGAPHMMPTSSKTLVDIARAEYDRSKYDAELQFAQQLRIKKLEDEKKPDGRCPNCDSKIKLHAESCAKCGAIFGSHSSWQVLSIK